MNSLLLAMRVARYTPRSVTRVGAWAGANVGWVRKGKSRTRLEENLHRVTGLTGRDLARLSRQGMLSAGRYYAEVLEMPRITEHQADARCRLANPEPVTSHIHEANGAVVVLSHSGNWDLVGYVATRLIAPVTSVAETLKPRELFEQFVGLRASVGIRIYGHDDPTTYRELLREASGSEERLIALVGDRDMTGRGVPVTMWGRGVRVAPGPAAIAKASGMPLIPVMVYYERLRGAQRRAARSKWGTVFQFGPTVTVPKGSSAEAVEQMSRDWSAWIADAIAAHPQDWHMLQRFGWIE